MIFELRRSYDRDGRGKGFAAVFRSRQTFLKLGVFDLEIRCWQFCNPKQQMHRRRAPNSLGQSEVFTISNTPKSKMTLAGQRKDAVGKRAHFRGFTVLVRGQARENLQPILFRNIRLGRNMVQLSRRGS